MLLGALPSSTWLTCVWRFGIDFSNQQPYSISTEVLSSKYPRSILYCIASLRGNILYFRLLENNLLVFWSQTSCDAHGGTEVQGIDCALFGRGVRWNLERHPAGLASTVKFPAPNSTRLPHSQQRGIMELQSTNFEFLAHSQYTAVPSKALLSH